MNMLCFIIMAQAMTTPLDPIRLDAETRLVRVESRRASVAGSVELIRLNHVRDWLPLGYVDKALDQAISQTDRHPLNRAVALWLKHQNALVNFDTETAAATRISLGLLNQFNYKIGPAPHPTANYQSTSWTAFPSAKSTGLLRVGAFVSEVESRKVTLITDLFVDEKTAGVLRFGYGQGVKIWLNGDLMFRSNEAHDAWLDQYGVVVHLRKGRNRLMVELADPSQRWTFVARITDSQGHLLPLTHSRPVDVPVPEAVDGPLTDGPVVPWAVFSETLKVDPPEVEALIDLAWYAYASKLPNKDKSLIQVALNGAFETRPDAETLHAWTLVLDSDRAAQVRQQYSKTAGQSGHLAHQLYVQTALIWDHVFERRLNLAWPLAQTVRARFERSGPIQRVWALLHEDLGWVQSAAFLAQSAADDRRRQGLSKTIASTLQNAGRINHELAHLRQAMKMNLATEDQRLRLAFIERRRGNSERADQLVSEMVKIKPELWRHQLTAVEALLERNRYEAALLILDDLEKIAPHHSAWVETRIDALLALGRVAEAITLIKRMAPRLDEDVLDRLRLAVNLSHPKPRLGPPTSTLSDIPCTGPIARVLHHHARTELNDDGRATRWVRRVIKICDRVGAERYSSMDIYHAPNSQALDIVRAQRLGNTGGQNAKRSGRSLSDPDNRIYFDLRAETLDFDGSQPGDIIEVMWQLRDTVPHPAMPGHYGEIAYLQEEIPRVTSVLEFASSPSKNLHVGIEAKGLQINRSPGRIVVKDVPGIPVQNRGPGVTNRFGYVHLSTQKKWASVDTLYKALLGKRAKPTPELVKLARSQIRPSMPAIERIEALYQLVAGRIRYVGLEYGIHSFQPAYASDTLNRGYGDCKDKAVLLLALLEAIGIDGRFVLVRTRSSGPLGLEPASLSVFDHAIIYIPSLGRFMDPTVADFDPWTLPTEDQGATALIIGSEKLTRIPFMDPDQQHEAWTLELRWNNGLADGTVKLATRGQPATELRRALLQPTQQTQNINQWLNRLLPNHLFKQYQFGGVEPVSDPVTIIGQIQPLVGQNTRANSPLFVGLAPWNLVNQWAPEAMRDGPLILPHKYLRTVTYSLTHDPKTRFETNLKRLIKSPFGFFSAHIEQQGTRLEVRLKLSISTTMVPREEYGKFRSWLAEIDAALTTQMRITHDGI
ncbi:MAG: DUF3857 domain-containing protein [Myxococcota bacterium]|nr:DUF3857 domain-containing protein [Myxococcota bacterium]